MYSFVVLGIIPGTNISISFSAWLAAAGLLVLVSFRKRVVRPEVVRVRQVLPASVLHRRFI
jgi:hypothetical protein